MTSSGTARSTAAKSSVIINLADDLKAVHKEEHREENVT